MGSPYADRFLTNVYKRSDYDRVLHLGILMFILYILPITFVLTIVVLLLLLGFDIEVIETANLVGVELFCNVISAYVVYMVVRTANLHRKRDKDWSESLIGYTEYLGHDATALKEIASEMTEDNMELATKILNYTWKIVLVVSILLGYFLSIRTVSEDTVMTLLQIIAALMLLQLAAISCYIFIKIGDHDNRQCRFTQALADILKDDLEGITPMETRLGKPRFWPHAIIFILTLTLYSIIFIPWSIYRMNKHISLQWTYEENLLTMIAKKESATGVVAIKKEFPEGPLNTALRFIQDIG